LDLPFWGFHPFRPLRVYPNWVVNKHHVISHSHDLLQPCNKDLDRADSIVLSCYNTNLYSYLQQVVTSQHLSFSHKFMFIYLCFAPISKMTRLASDQAPVSAPVSNKTSQHSHSTCLHIFTPMLTHLSAIPHLLPSPNTTCHLLLPPLCYFVFSYSHTYAISLFASHLFLLCFFREQAFSFVSPAQA